MTSDASDIVLVPVVDLLRGEVVRAVRGDRQSYQPVRSQLCAGSRPVTVATALCEHCAASRLYIADLDALQGGEVQVAVVAEVMAALPEVELWLDAGFADAGQAAAVLARLGEAARRVVPVFASESLASRAVLAQCFSGPGAAAPDAALSLDRRDGRRLDAAGCWDAPALWPRKVIVMTLERVGSGEGPDLDTLADVRRQAPQAWLVGAGGVRSQADLARARAAGADAWLVASALHDGGLPRAAR